MEDETTGPTRADDDTPDVDQDDHESAAPSEDWTHLGPRCVNLD